MVFLKKDLVSIIVPVYNVEKYVSECVNSLRRQSYNKIEIILVDDGSKDRSGLICDSFMKIDKRITVIHKKNEGLGYARNAGLNVAKGEYVYFIDSDDIVGENIISELVAILRKNSCDTVIGGYTRVDNVGKQLYETAYKSFLYESNSSIKNELLPRLFGSSPIKRDSVRMSVWNVLFSMSIIKENKLSFLSERDVVSEDIIWDIDYYKNAQKVLLTNFTDYFYRKRDKSLTNINDPLFLKKINKLYQLELNKMNDELNSDIKFRIKREYFVNLVSCFSQAAKNKKIISAIQNLRELVNDSFVRRIINEYPYKDTNLKARTFLTLIMRKRVFILLVLFRYHY